MSAGSCSSTVCTKHWSEDVLVAVNRLCMSILSLRLAIVLAQTFPLRHPEEYNIRQMLRTT